MIEAFSWVIDTYGKDCQVKKNGAEPVDAGKAIVQSMTKSDWAYTNKDIEEFDPDSKLALMEPTDNFKTLVAGDIVIVEDVEYTVQTTRPIIVGGETTHIWACLK